MTQQADTNKQYNKTNLLNLVSNLYNQALINHLGFKDIDTMLEQDPDWAHKMATNDVIFNLFFKTTSNMSDDKLRELVEAAIIHRQKPS